VFKSRANSILLSLKQQKDETEENIENEPVKNDDVYKEVYEIKSIGVVCRHHRRRPVRGVEDHEHVPQRITECVEILNRFLRMRANDDETHGCIGHHTTRQDDHKNQKWGQ
jgi:hypothetical protein